MSPFSLGGNVFTMLLHMFNLVVAGHVSTFTEGFTRQKCIFQQNQQQQQKSFKYKSPCDYKYNQKGGHQRQPERSGQQGKIYRRTMVKNSEMQSPTSNSNAWNVVLAWIVETGIRRGTGNRMSPKMKGKNVLLTIWDWISSINPDWLRLGWHSCMPSRSNSSKF